ncbi:Protein trichome birefringence-like 11 [Camellia lanceoleosa]|uniref:Protein trichome birefringence-like 11 n=1 Tax=Camellia lanceoleosa TaxID=1840588 RepID=A0ACC0F2P3_9ERIC|nr:Protein trichome birefringence-like 11 [Camellia lanceoleosa]
MSNNPYHQDMETMPIYFDFLKKFKFLRLIEPSLGILGFFIVSRYPDVAKFREKPLTLADDMDILFSDVSATGEWAYTPSSGVFLDTEGSHTPLGDDTDMEIHPSELSNQCHRLKEGPSKKQKGNKKQSAAGELSKTLNCIVDAVEASSSTGTQNAAM